MKILITGGAGFIGSALIKYILESTDHNIMNVDSLTYASNLGSLASILNHSGYKFKKVDVCDKLKIGAVIHQYRPDAIVHLAAESHVDRSIDSPMSFVQTNIVGTYNLLESSFEYWKGLDDSSRKKFRFYHISTDEVYGDLAENDPPFTEISPYSPSSPYSASKAAADHLVKAWHRTYGLPIVLTNCSNNYGPYQFPEKLIPLIILNAVEKKPLPVYGDGSQIRDWLYVGDHAKAILMVLTRGNVGEVYNIGGNSEKTNIQVVNLICEILQQELPGDSNQPYNYKNLIQHVQDRPGHDRRYAINSNKIAKELGWRPKETFETGLRKTVQWYLNNLRWSNEITNYKYQGERLGIVEKGMGSAK